MMIYDRNSLNINLKNLLDIVKEMNLCVKNEGTMKSD
jgi:hypothetical protein